MATLVKTSSGTWKALIRKMAGPLSPKASAQSVMRRTGLGMSLGALAVLVPQV